MSKTGRMLLASLIALALLLSPMLMSPALAAFTADPGGPYSGTVGEKIRFDGSASDPGDGNIKSYIWDFGDGGTAKGVTVDHAYQEAKEYPVTLTITDNAKPRNTSTESTTATIEDPAPRPPPPPPHKPTQKKNKKKKQKKKKKKTKKNK